MSLQVWLPLNGDLTQQGLSDIEITNNGATIDANGKIGSCYLFDGTNDYAIGSYKATKEISFSAWINMPTIKSAHIIDARTSSGVGYQPIYITSSTIQIGNSGSSYVNFNYNWVVNTWYHICVTYSAEKGSFYVNGVLINSSASAKGVDLGTCNFTLGSRCNQANYSNVKMNDVRIYDHCLSPKEVKELSKGLILHYKLDKCKQTLINAYNYPTFNTATATAGWSHWGRTNAVGTNGQNQDKQYIFRPNQQYSHWVANASTANMDTGGYLFYQAPAFEGGYRSIQCIVKEENGLPITEEIVMPAWNGRNGGAAQNIWTSIESLGNGFYLCKCEGISQDGSNDLIGFYIGPGYKVYFSEAYCEDNKETCTDIFSLEDFEFDSSGYNHQGSTLSAPTISMDTPQYSHSISFDGTDDGILIENLVLNPIINNSVTYSFWIKPNGENSARSVYFGSYSGISWSIEKNTAKNLRLYWNGSPDETTSGFSIIDDEWQHICIVKNGTADVKVYYNGIQKWASTANHNTLTFPTTYRIGRDTRSGDNTPYKGLMSDFRIYATALSADDVLELYHTAASIDNKGNLFCREVVE